MRHKALPIIALILFSISLYASPIGPNDMQELKKEVLDFIHDKDIKLLGLSAEKDQGKLEFMVKNKRAQVLFSVTTPSKQCKGLSYKRLCVHLTPSPPLEDVERLVYRVLKHQQEGKELRTIKRLVDKHHPGEALELIQTVEPENDPVLMGEMALIWNRLGHHDNFATWCKRAMAGPIPVRAADKLILHAICGPMGQVEREYDNYIKSEKDDKDCIIQRLTRILAEKGQNRRALFFIKGHEKQIFKCNDLFKQAFVLAATRRDCRLLADLTAGVSGSRLNRGLIRILRKNNYPCDMEISVLKFLITRGNCGDIDWLLNLLNRVKKQLGQLRKELVSATDQPTCPIKTMTEAWIMLNQGKWNAVLRLTSSIKSKDLPGRWLTLFRAIALHNTGATARSRLLLQGIATPTDRPGELASQMLGNHVEHEVEHLSLNKGVLSLYLGLLVVLLLPLWLWWTRS